MDQDAVLAFEEFIERKWQDALNIAANEPNPRQADGERGDKGTPVPKKTSWEGQGTLRLTGAVNVIERGGGVPGPPPPSGTSPSGENVEPETRSGATGTM